VDLSGGSPLGAESPVELQTMINALHKYCLLWGLLVNIEKSKVLIFKRHWRRLAQNEKWNLGSIQLEIVKSYKYLGVWIYHNGRFNNHLQEKLREAKLAINCTWKSLLGKKDVPMSSKYKLFSAAMRLNLCYGAQFWGISPYEEVESLLILFLKKIFRLPIFTPNRMLYLETGLSPLHIFTSEIHFRYAMNSSELFGAGA